MTEARNGLCLASDPRCAVLAIDDLDRDGTLQPLVPGSVDGAEATASDPLLDPEPAQDSLAHHFSSQFGTEVPIPVHIRSRPQAVAQNKSLRASPFAPRWSDLVAA